MKNIMLYSLLLFLVSSFCLFAPKHNSDSNLYEHLDSDSGNESENDDIVNLTPAVQKCWMDGKKKL